MSEYNMQILVCGGTGCKASESEEIRSSFVNLLSKYGLEDEVQVVMTGCFGFCEKGPIVEMMPDKTFYGIVNSYGRIVLPKRNADNGENRKR